MHFHEGPSFCGRRQDKTTEPCHVLRGPNEHEKAANNLQVKVKTHSLAADSKMTFRLNS